jgi:antitoxin VapB
MADPKRSGVPESAKVFVHGGSQAVRLPKAYRFDTKEVLIRKEGDAVILEPKPAERRMPETDAEWSEHWARLDSLSDDEFPDPPPQTITPAKTWW